MDSALYVRSPLREWTVFGIEVNLSRNFLHQAGQFSIAANNKVVENNLGKFLEGYILELPKATKVNWWKIYTSS